ncbi:MAG: 1-deoxy-D-xylulose-5-phosphate reductoisomerase [Treponema sp.]|jgi:1-deoxy-D-xylulose-5-phosphate reductoisomerase|nr:1-deoxy-D-xylulose-5-phosphate reductoisomerase [Treponema sp.]
MKKRVAVLGATGSIGKSTLDVLRRNKNSFEAVLFSAHKDEKGILALAEEFPAATAVLTGAGRGAEGIGYFGVQGLFKAIAACGGDIGVNGIAGAAGLEPSLAILRAGMDLALANKETIVMAADLVFALAAEKQVRILPIDSEHAAIFTLIEAHSPEQVQDILLTASGGPFRNHTWEQLRGVNVREALAHPTWSMGAKITIDSATMANKGLEVIEAARLFGLPPDRIKAVVHPQSIVHSMVRCKDGAVYAQMSRPDMRLPIQNALFYPNPQVSSFETLNFDALTLEFAKPDEQKFPMLPLAYQALHAGPLYPAVYNAANETAAAAFLNERIGFLDIPRVVRSVLERQWSGSMDLESILDIDRRARNLAAACIGGIP